MLRVAALLPGIKTHNWEVRTPPAGTYTLQNDGYNCGAMVCLYAEKIIKGDTLIFSPSEGDAWRHRALNTLSPEHETSDTNTANELRTGSNDDGCSLELSATRIPSGSTLPEGCAEKREKPSKTDRSEPTLLCRKTLAEIDTWHAERPDDWRSFELICEAFASSCKSSKRGSKKDDSISSTVCNDNTCDRAVQAGFSFLKKQAEQKGTNERKEAGEQQRQFNSNPKAAMRKVLQQQSQYCQVAPETIVEHFSKILETKAVDEEDINTLGESIPNIDLPQSFMEDFKPSEVVATLKSMKNTAPGDDGVTYRSLLHADPSGKALTAIYNVCLTHRRIPARWKTANTILIYKKRKPKVHG